MKVRSNILNNLSNPIARKAPKQLINIEGLTGQTQYNNSTWLILLVLFIVF